MKSKIKWMDWGKKSFERAKREDKPVLLDLTAVWCHWCHVMDSTSYSDDGIIKTINSHFIPIKVYIDERPDIKDKYNMGGFPSTVFLTPEGHIIAGATYVQPSSMKQMLDAVRKAYAEKKEEIKKMIAGNQNKVDEKKSMKGPIKEEAVDKMLLMLEDSYDPIYGGFGMQQKFPFPEAMNLLLLQYKKSGKEKYLKMALKTLDWIDFGLSDKVDHGFFRYSVTQDWKTPHYEKLLETNAGLIGNYALAYFMTKDDKYKKIISDTVAYVDNFLRDRKTGCFYGSQDADEEFYRLDKQGRKKQKQPRIDKTIYADWNAMMISAYIKAGAATKDYKLIKHATGAAETIIRGFYSKKEGIIHSSSRTSVNGLLCDNIHFLDCLIDVYQATQNKRYKDVILELAGFMKRNFYDDKGGFFSAMAREGDIGLLKNREKNFMENCLCAIAFLKVYYLSKDMAYLKCAEKTLEHFQDRCLELRHFAASYAIAADMLINGEIKVDVLGSREMFDMCIACANPRVTATIIDKKSSRHGSKAAYVCRGDACKIISTKEELERELY